MALQLDLYPTCVLHCLTEDPTGAFKKAFATAEYPLWRSICSNLVGTWNRAPCLEEARDCKVSSTVLAWSVHGPVTAR